MKFRIRSGADYIGPLPEGPWAMADGIPMTSDKNEAFFWDEYEDVSNFALIMYEQGFEAQIELVLERRFPSYA